MWQVYWRRSTVRYKDMKKVPEHASQHVTAGPYNPVLEIENIKKLVVISGQAPLDVQGNVIGETIEEQTLATLKNCKQQLETAGCTMDDVFKVNAFLTNLEEWGRFNQVYQTYMPKPFPVRTAVGVALLNTFKIEIEMWASK